VQTVQQQYWDPEMFVGRSSETLLTVYQSTLHHIPQELNISLKQLVQAYLFPELLK